MTTLENLQHICTNYRKDKINEMTDRIARTPKTNYALAYRYRLQGASSKQIGKLFGVGPQRGYEMWRQGRSQTPEYRAEMRRWIDEMYPDLNT